MIEAPQPIATRIYDIETLVNFFLYMDVDYKTGEKRKFRIGLSHNDLAPLVTYLRTGRINQVGFNNCNFDSQVTQYIIENELYWTKHNFTGPEINDEIYKYSQVTIAKMNGGGWADYPEWKQTVPQLDLFKIWHFDNKSKSTSLKWLQFSMDWHNLQDMPMHHSEPITEEQIEEVEMYCDNDIMSTLQFFDYTMGRCEHPEYKGKDKLQLRKNIKDKFKIKCLNFNDVKIGDELNKKSYMELTGADKYELKNRRAPNDSFTFGQCIPEYVSFKTPELIEFYNKVKDITVNLKEKQNQKLRFKGTNYIIAKGGIHSEDKPRVIKPNDNQWLLDADIGSQYPNAIRKRGLHPRQLGPEWLEVYCANITSRLEAKKQFGITKDKTYKSIDELFKLALNGGGFGKTGQPTSWQYDPFISMSVTIGNQFEILLLIEMLETAGIHVISANTDGIVCMFNKSLQITYYRVCKEWEVIVGNDKQGMLEYTDYELFIQMSVNDYIAVKRDKPSDPKSLDDRAKTKGDFLIDFELHKNKSNRIVNLALLNYFVHGTDPKVFIPEQRNIYDFCACVRATGDFYLEEEGMVNGEVVTNKLQKTVRYYISKEGMKLLKRHPDGRQLQTDAGMWRQTVFNRFVEKPWEDYAIDYKYYIERTYNIINSIQPDVTAYTIQTSLNFAA